MSTTDVNAPLDTRLSPYMGIDTLIRLWVEHTPADLPAPATCPGCGHPYTPTAPLCPTAAIVRPLLYRRRHERGISHVIGAMSLTQWSDLTSAPAHLSTHQPTPADRPWTRPTEATTPTPGQPDLFGGAP